MQVRTSLDDPRSLDIPLLVIPVFRDARGEPLTPEGTEALLEGGLARAVAAGDLRGRDDEALLFYRSGGVSGGPARVLLLGGGARTEVDAERLRRIGARAVREAEARSITELAFVLPAELPIGPALAAQAVAEGAVLAAWDFRELRSTPAEENGRDPVADEPVRPLVESLRILGTVEEPALEAGVRVGVALAEGENFARTLQARPGNVATPRHLAETALELAERHGFSATILGPEALVRERMHALLAVSAGSDEEPRLIVLEHRGGAEGDPPLALVGKGLTFDAGGISIKPAQGMEEMKYDMSGGAAVLGAMDAVGSLGLPLNVVAVVPSSENLLSGKATKPGDVIRTRAGRTVEVVNTDAEGRLILADALSWVIDHHAPRAIVDCATLTGACVIALGNQAAAVLGSEEDLVEELRSAGDRSGERCWPLPLWKEYVRQLESPVADLKNVGGRPAGTITAACFLRQFVGDTPWAHLDIAGTAYGEPRGPYHRKGPLGFPTRLLVEWLRSRSA